ncbi:DUF6647 family protein [Bradyrhizobium sp. UFLA05-112]
MFRQFFLVVAVGSLALLDSPKADCRDDLGPSVAAGSSSVQLRLDAARSAEELLDEVASWLSSNFDLPAIKDHPAIEFASKAKLATMRASDHAHWQGLTQDEGIDRLAQRTVVALYDNNSKTIFLPDDWIGKSPADQSVLVHEMVHHLQNMAEFKFECPMAREKLAYLAQDKWLRRFGTSLESEFDVDMFTVLISSACMY